MRTLRDPECRAGLISRLSNLVSDAKPRWGKMSVEQMLSHLVQAGEMPFVASVPDRSTFVSHHFVRPLILYLLPIPKGVKTSPQLDQQKDGRSPTGFDADRELVVESIKKIGTLPEGHECLGHPFFGKMSAKQWAVLAHKHIDHHLRQFGV